MINDVVMNLHFARSHCRLLLLLNLLLLVLLIIVVAIIVIELYLIVMEIRVVLGVVLLLQPHF